MAQRPRLTDEQSLAITQRGVSIALSAGAGCGKTFVLTERFLSHLQPGADPTQLSQLVAITFTERAAREMRDRIRRTCQERVQYAAEGEAPYWLNLLRQLEARGSARSIRFAPRCSVPMRSRRDSIRGSASWNQIRQTHCSPS